MAIAYHSHLPQKSDLGECGEFSIERQGIRYALFPVTNPLVGAVLDFGRPLHILSILQENCGI